MKIKSLALIFLGLGLVLVSILLRILENSSATEIVPAFTLTVTNASLESLPTATETIITIATPTATEVPQLVDDFILNNTINLSSSKSTVIALYLPNGNLLSFPTWAEAVSEEDADIDAFEVHEGTVYSLYSPKGGEEKSGEATMVTLLHSGMVYNSPDKLAGSNFDRFITRESTEADGIVSFLQGSRLLTVAEGTEKANSLVGSTGYICQKEGVAPFIVYTGDCENGQLLQVKVKSVALVLGQQSMLYDWTIAKGEILPWLQSNFVGFDLASPRTGFLISTCIHQFADQPDLENVKPYLQNRLGMWLEFIY